MGSPELLAASEISTHKTSDDCWIVVGGNVWDVTDFAPTHPGGEAIILRYGGRDATAAYSAIHAPSIIKEGLPPTAFKGTLDLSTVTDSWSRPLKAESPRSTPSALSEKPALESRINADDFELAAKAYAPAKTWAFYSSADTDLVTLTANRTLYSRIWFRPRILRKVSEVSTATSMLGVPCMMPLMVSPAGMARLIHPQGELALAGGCAAKNIIQCIATTASYSATEIAAVAPEHSFFFQLYVDRNRSKSEALLRKLQEAAPNVKAVFITVDAAATGKREADERLKADESYSSPMIKNKAKNDRRGGGIARIMGNFIDPALSWDDVAWARRATHLPLLLKGVMCADDVKMAFEHGLDGVLLSNHGGRNLDTSPPAILVLLECHRRIPEIFSAKTPRGNKFEIHIDGGIRRGTDILKCLCLGATAVGMGRSFLFATGYGQEGVEHLIDILEDELKVAMANVGISSLAEVGPHLVNTGDIDHLIPQSASHPYAQDFRKSKL
ncbi:uncharacterized protein Z520_12062 [Fonsecaea multimorphosa CBS 102226]|uniref:L-lactate dehydrogenase (cytochrome) n=1 Tax=Fonsecaea multimorphosa CBS 102226 TaxID=1442371 RepID=A0A0D2I4H2_9EURO|nr:uncharacterized protein Z520_12062 [Fonsecaea multimorphosa CBS 102226]KIX92181.1 hypothetical protein Z520_12062 [Fonsecaea multimorphosa CBS 102226]OAL17558.1 hypothetical protein AYO22_11476 [Fonsecaea multimorphosa]